MAKARGCNSWKVGSLVPRISEWKLSRRSESEVKGKGGDESGSHGRDFSPPPIKHRRLTTSGLDRYIRSTSWSQQLPLSARCVLACKTLSRARRGVEEVKYERERERECARLVKVSRAPRVEKTIDTSASRYSRLDVFRSSANGRR